MGTNNLTFLLALVLASIFTLSQSKLVYLLEVSRHGAKFPSKSMISTNDSVNIKGQLTGVGQRQQYLLGTYLHQDYIVEQQIVSGRLNGR